MGGRGGSYHYYYFCDDRQFDREGTVEGLG